MMHAIYRVFNNTYVQVAMMIWTSCLALSWSQTDQLITLMLICCAVFWIFRVWGGLRERSET